MLPVSYARAAAGPSLWPATLATMRRRGRVREFFSEWRARRAGSHFVSSRIPGTFREAVGRSTSYSHEVTDTVVRSVEEQRRSDVLNASHFGEYPSHSALRRMSDDPSKPRRPKP